MQKASLGNSEWWQGLKITHGLVGSVEWYETIERGDLPLKTAIGRVSQFWPGHHGDFQEFELQTDSGTTSKWPCFLTMPRAESEFAIGRTVEVSFVEQQFRHPREDMPQATVVVAIRLGSNHSYMDSSRK